MLALAASLGIASSASAVTITEFSAGITATSQPRGIASGPDGNMWFTDSRHATVGRITPQGAVTVFSEGITPAGRLRDRFRPGRQDVVHGFGVPVVGSITAAGTITEFDDRRRPARREDRHGS